MGTVTGLPSADDTTVVPGYGADLAEPDLYDLTFLNTPDVSCSYAYARNIPSPEHVLATSALMHASYLDTLTASQQRLTADILAAYHHPPDPTPRTTPSTYTSTIP